MTIKKAMLWTLFWIFCALLVNAAVYVTYGQQKAMEFLAGYVIEESLSVDNLFVFLLIFGYFKISPAQQRRALNYGIMGVILLRGIMIYLGSSLVMHFHWILYVFGIVLLYSGYKIAFGGEMEVNPENNIVMRIVKRFIPVHESYTGDRFFIRHQGKWLAAPLLIALIVIETTDVFFAIDSIPAVFGITTDPRIVLSSNFMAVLGLRSIYFILEKIHDAFYYVKYGVGIVLVFVGVKMVLDVVYPIGTFVSLCVVVSILSLSVILSAMRNTSRA